MAWSRKHSPQVRALERALWAPSAAPSFRFEQWRAAHMPRLRAAMDEAWRGQDWLRFAMLAGACRRQGPLDRKLAWKFCFSLLHTRRFADALKALGETPEIAADDSGRWMLTTRSLAGLGRLAEALEAAERWLGLAPDDAAARGIRDELARALELDARLDAEAGWPRFRELVDLYWTFGWSAGVARVVRRFLRRGARPGPEDRDDLLDAATAALSSMDGEEVYALMCDLEALFDPGPERELIGDTLAVLLGTAQDPAGGRTGRGLKIGRNLRVCAAQACLAGGRRAVSAARLAELSSLYGKDWEVRILLARAVGDEMLAGAPVAYRSGGGEQTIDLVMFNNERELLKIKLAEEAPWVDRFVIVEATQTFTGQPKPLNFAAWRADFAEFADKITYVTVESFPDWATTPWARDFHQREMGVRGASGLWGVDDLVLVTDADEVVDRRAVEGFDGEIAGLRMATYRYFLNWRRAGGTRQTGVMLRARYLQTFGASLARFALRDSSLARVLDDSGWHFTSVADAAALAAKMKSYAHQEHSFLDAGDFERALDAIRRGGKPDAGERVAIDAALPAYVREHRAQLEHLILPV